MRLSRSLAVLALLVGGAALTATDSPAPRSAAERDGEPHPSDWFAAQRAYPYDHIPQDRFRQALTDAEAMRQQAGLTTSGTGLTWQNAGPINVGGRVTALDAAPGGIPAYLGAANGGVFRSDDGGVHWSPIFDQYGIYSIGALALAPGDPNTLYVGTGEANASVDSYDGNGVYRTTDGGGTWQFLGLAATARIARVAIDPLDPSRIFVAAMGTQFSTGPDRGLYRSTDGGAHWTQVLFVNDSTGVCDVVINPVHPDTVFAASWERVRHNTYRRAYGPDCGIWRSADGGDTWTRLENGLPAPSDQVARIALAIAPTQPSTVYAQIGAGLNGVQTYYGLGLYRSTDGGDTWARRDLANFVGSFGGFSWYFGAMAADPANPDLIWCLGVSILKSGDGGANYSDLTNGTHVDQHAIWIDPTDTQRVFLGNDGGFYWSENGGASWGKSTDLPITQFYAGAVDPADVTHLFGGTQDNNTLMTAGAPDGWVSILGGDGFYCQVDPTNSNVVLKEWQFCCGGTGPRRSTSGGPGGSAPSGVSTSDRWNWSTPFLFDPLDHNVVLLGSQRVYKSTDNGVSYTPISGDLTTAPVASLVYGTITTIDISPVDGTTYFVGTDDGKVWRSPDAGGTWDDVTAGLPARWVTRVTADPTDANTVYVTLSGFSEDEHLPHVYRSTDLGDHWTSIAGNLPDAPANDLLVDPSDPLTLYLATDLGVYATRDGGTGWFPLGQGMPLQTVFDLTLHQPTRTLVAATHGRSQWTLDLAGLPVATPAPGPVAALELSAPRPNPSRGTTRFEVRLPRAEDLAVEVLDASGRRVATLHRGAAAAGVTGLTWSGRDRSGARVAPGVYFLRARAGGSANVRRIVRMD